MFVIAAVAKLADSPGSRRALEDFRIPSGFVRPAAALLPAAELLAAGLLLLAPTARVGASLAAALLGAFVAGIALALRQGRTPDCHCFGQLHSRPAGRETIARNLVLATGALLVLFAGPGPGIGDWMSDSSGETVALAATSLACLVLAYVALTLWQDNRRLSGGGRAADVPALAEAGDPVPEFAVTDFGGDEVRSADLLAGEHSVVVFVSATCGPCLRLLPELARWREMLSGRMPIHVLTSGDENENRRLAEENRLEMLLDRAGAAAGAVGILGTPSAVEVDDDGRIASPPVAGGQAIEALIRSALKRKDAPALDVQSVAGASAAGG